MERQKRPPEKHKRTTTTKKQKKKKQTKKEKMERTEDAFFENGKWETNDKSKSKRKNRSSHRKCSVEKGVPKNFAKFTGNRLRSATY